MSYPIDIVGAGQESQKNRRNTADLAVIARQLARTQGRLAGNSGRQLLVWADDLVIADGPRDGFPGADLGESVPFGLKSLSRLATGLLFGDRP